VKKKGFGVEGGEVKALLEKNIARREQIRISKDKGGERRGEVAARPSEDLPRRRDSDARRKKKKMRGRKRGKKSHQNRSCVKFEENQSRRQDVEEKTRKTSREILYR